MVMFYWHNVIVYVHVYMYIGPFCRNRVGGLASHSILNSFYHIIVPAHNFSSKLKTSQPLKCTSPQIHVHVHVHVVSSSLFLNSMEMKLLSNHCWTTVVRIWNHWVTTVELLWSNMKPLSNYCTIWWLLYCTCTAQYMY